MKWYENQEVLKAAYEKYGSLEAAAREIGGVHKSTLAQAWRKHGLGVLPRGPVPRPENQNALRELHQSVYGKSK